MIQTCLTCRYFRELKSISGGHCHRYPPAPLLQQDGSQLHQWPTVRLDHWCGEYMADAEKSHPGWRYGGNDPGIALFDACLRDGAPMPFGSDAAPIRVLEVGCCESDWLERARVAWPHAEFVGVDQRETRHVRGDVLNTELFEAERFDAVVSLSAIEHIGLGHYGDAVDADGDSKAVANIWRWLKPGGWFYFDVPYDPTRYSVKGTECRVYDTAALWTRLLAHPNPRTVFWPTGAWRDVYRAYAHARYPGTLVPQPTQPVDPFHYVAMVWRKV